MVAVQLSAQCTDKRVNQITPALFKRIKNWNDLAEISQLELERYVFSTGFLSQ
jgi:endonuclease-3